MFEQKRWIIYPQKTDDIIDQLLINRGIKLEEKECFLNCDYKTGLHDPFLFRDMKKAVERIKLAIDRKEKVGIFGDYDADGIPGAALLYKVFRLIGLEVSVYIPTREEGYGLNERGVRELSKSGCKIMVTVDLGIVNDKEVELANNLGMDVIITDHHELQKDRLPKKAVAILHPRLPDQKYPNPDLAGGGVALKFVQALSIKLQVTSYKLQVFFKWLFDLAAISTIADCVPLVGENRVIAKYGLIVLQKTKNLGLQKLYEVAKIDPKSINTYSVGFQIAPRINAPGRMDHAQASFYLLTTGDHHEATEIAKKLNKINHERQDELERVLTEARMKVEKRGLQKKKVILVEGKNWPMGIIGLVAGKLMEEFSRPVIVFREEKGELKGSARSIDGFHILEALEQCKKYLSGFGGHAKAAGVSLELKNLSKLYDRLLEIAESKLSDEDLSPKTNIDLELPAKDINYKLYDILKKFEPHGIGNQRPVFLMKSLVISNLRLVGKDGKHLKLKLRASSLVTSNLNNGSNYESLVTSYELNAIGFNLGQYNDKIKIDNKIDVVFTLDENVWNGNKSLQLKILDLRKV